MANVMDAMPEGVDPRAMTAEDFNRFMHNAIKKFDDHVQKHEDYQFARDGETMPLGDWFEQFGTSTGVM